MKKEENIRKERKFRYKYGNYKKIRKKEKILSLGNCRKSVKKEPFMKMQKRSIKDALKNKQINNQLEIPH